ncbi:NYN domain-containing protein [Rhizobium sp. NXC14]|uniref:NYN domain-containing protein n=1 Tax=Rhizobium sp. NXC14 TaxID=1981173 RepID=UPI001FD8E63B|nr:NYN domain-containing protein [Rhizobium sp. NXC14]
MKDSADDNALGPWPSDGVEGVRAIVARNSLSASIITRLWAGSLKGTGRFSGFCIVSSDSDFARLAARIREQGVTVYGFGERKTPRPFITACDKFVYFDVLNTQAEEADRAAAPTQQQTEVKPSPAKQPAKKAGLNKAARDMLIKAIIATADEDGRANLAQVGGHLAKQAPDFDARNYGFPRLSDLVKSSGIVDVERSPENPKTILVRLKKT